jgi:hypothetical protein
MALLSFSMDGKASRALDVKKFESVDIDILCMVLCKITST